MKGRIFRRIHLNIYSLPLFVYIIAIYNATQTHSFLGGVFLLIILIIISCLLPINKKCDFQKIDVIILAISMTLYIISLLGFSAIFSRLGIIVLSTTQLGLYGVKQLKQRDDILEQILKLLFCIAILFSVIYMTNNVGNFSPDSFGYFDIAKSIGNDFGKINTIRQYVVRTDYNISFPYLFPFLIWIFDKITGLQIYSGVLLNIFLMFGTCYLIKIISEKVTNNYKAGYIVISILLTNKEYLEEVSAARSIPLALFIIVLIIYMSLEYLDRRKLNTIWFLGLLSGFYLSTRQDGLPLVPYALLIIFIFLSPKVKTTIVYLTGFIITILPQILYAEIRFGKLFVSDNSGTFFRVNSTEWITLPGEEQTLFSATNAWLEALIGKIITVFKSLIQCSIPADILIIMCFFLIIFICKKYKFKSFEIKVIFLSIIYYLGKTAMYMLVGYSDIRYHIETVTIVLFILLLGISRALKENGLSISVLFNQLKYKRCICVGWIGFFIICSIWSVKGSIKQLVLNPFSIDIQKVGEKPEWIESIDEKLNEAGINENDKIMFIGSDASPYAFGSYSNRYVYAMPGNVTLEQVTYIIKKYGDVDYIIVENNSVYSEFRMFRDEYKSIDNYTVYKNYN